jgi:hypothetical protein
MCCCSSLYAGGDRARRCTLRLYVNMKSSNALVLICNYYFMFLWIRYNHVTASALMSDCAFDNEDLAASPRKNDNACTISRLMSAEDDSTQPKVVIVLHSESSEASPSSKRKQPSPSSPRPLKRRPTCELQETGSKVEWSDADGSVPVPSTTSARTAKTTTKRRTCKLLTTGVGGGRRRLPSVLAHQCMKLNLSASCLVSY